jgi:hypothetical protein
MEELPKRQFQGPVFANKWGLFPEIGVHKRVIPRGITGLTLFTFGALTSIIGHYIVVRDIRRRRYG